MKKFIAVCFLSLAACGNYTTPAVPHTTVQLPENECANRPCEDAFDKIGKTTADSGRWIWNHAKAAYEYLTSEELNAPLKKKCDAIRAAFDAALKEYEAKK